MSAEQEMIMEVDPASLEGVDRAVSRSEERFNAQELEAIAELADDYVRNGGLDINYPADIMGLIFVRGIFDKAHTALHTAKAQTGEDE
ncbi:MAG TPA: hypothetical protein VM715_01350 [Candidatus Acidoferrum sp.]|jgi:hypothetical protein|nr:hypothetical protein [Candidatus Acidoferrum sp.]